MIPRDYKLTLVGRMSNTIYVEHYFGVYEEALAEYTTICSNSSGVFKTIPEDTLIVRIDELTPTNLGQSYVNARVDWMFRDYEPDKKV